MPELYDSRAAQLGNSVSDIFNSELTKDRNQALKVASIIANDPNFSRRPDYWINIFNITPVEHIRHRPVDFPTIRIAGCPKSQPWVLAVRVPSTINYKWVSAETGQPSFASIRGERFATDLLNPANLGDKMWVEVTNPDMTQFHGGGSDLSRRGVFWAVRQKSDKFCEACQGEGTCSIHDVPSADDLRQAKSRLEAHYRQMVEKAEKLAQDPKTIGELGSEHHLAADYLHVNATWHRHTTLKEPCPNCGEEVNPGIAFHASSTGVICVIDWKRTVAAGARKREEVPLESRWWDDPELEEKTRPGKR